MTRGHLRVIAAFVLLVSTRIVALPSQADKNGDIDITQSLVKPHVVSLEGANNENRGSSVSPLSDKKLVVQQVEQSESKAKISSIVPPARASLNMGANDVLTLSFNVEASGIKRVRFFLELNGLGTSKYVIRSAADTYTLTLRGVPAGTSSWSIEIVTNSSNKDLKNQKFGPWEFSVQTESPTTSITAGLQNDCLTVDSSKFNICLDLKSVSGRYEPWMEDFGTARQRWEEILKDDGQIAVDIDPYWQFSREYIGTSLPPLVDDIYISGFVEPYDGRGGVLGMASPFLMRTDSKGYRRPISGFMVFDSADEASLRREGLWTTTILHEMGHVLGLGSLWRQNGLHSGSMYDDEYRALSNAQAAWEKICPGGSLPIETADASQGIGEGTAGGHWDEDCLVNELMTGFLDDEAFLSNITIASLADMGYNVDYSKAEPFGKDDLGDCGNYCPDQRRHLRVKVAPGKPSRRRKISASGRRKILRAAAREMGKIRSTTPTSLPKGMDYHAREYMTVFIMDEDGEMKEETVSWMEAKEYASDDIMV